MPKGQHLVAGGSPRRPSGAGGARPPLFEPYPTVAIDPRTGAPKLVARGRRLGRPCAGQLI